MHRLDTLLTLSIAATFSGAGMAQIQTYKPGVLTLVRIDPTDGLQRSSITSLEKSGREPEEQNDWQKICKRFGANFAWKPATPSRSFFDKLECGGQFRTVEDAFRSMKGDRRWLLAIHFESNSQNDIAIWRRKSSSSIQLEARVKGVPSKSRFFAIVDQNQEQRKLALKLMQQLPCLWVLEYKAPMSRMEIPFSVPHAVEKLADETLLFQLTLSKGQVIWGAKPFLLGIYQETALSKGYVLSQSANLRSGSTLCVANSQGREATDSSEWQVETLSEGVQEAPSLSRASSVSFNVQLPVGSSSGVDFKSPAVHSELRFGATDHFQNFRVFAQNRGTIRRVNDLGAYTFQEQRLEIGPEWAIPPLGIGGQAFLEIGVRPTLAAAKIKASQTLSNSAGTADYTITFAPEPGMLLGFDSMLFVQTERLDLELACGIRYYGLLPKQKNSWIVSGFACNNEAAFQYSSSISFPLSLNLIDYNIRKSGSNLSVINDNEETTLQNVNFIVSWLGIGVKYRW